MQQKRLHRWRLPPQDFLHQIIQDITLTPTHLIEQIDRISVSLQGEAEQVQADQPPLRLGGRILDNVCWELHAHHLLEKGQDLLRRATQLVGAYFQYLPTCSQQRKWQGRIGASGQDEMQLGREMLHEIGEGAVNLRLGDQVIVVEDQEKLLSSAYQGIDERLQDVSQEGSRRLLRLQIAQEGRAETRLLAIQCRECVGPELHRIVITFIQGNPCHMLRLRGML